MRVQEDLYVTKGDTGDGGRLALTLCKYDLRKDDLFVLTLARVQRVSRGSASSELLMCGGGVAQYLLSPLVVAKCLETIAVCIWHMFAFMSVVVTVWGSVWGFMWRSVWGSVWWSMWESLLCSGRC